MITCPSCGARNRIGTMFCADCGAKLDMEQAEIEIKKSQQGIHSRGVKRSFRIVRTLISLALLAGLAYVLVGVFLPVPDLVSEAADGADNAVALTKLDAMLKGGVGPRNVDMAYTFTSVEATLIANRLLGLEAGDGEAADAAERETGFTLIPSQLSVEFLASGFVRLVLCSHSYRDVKMYSVLIGRFEVGDDEVRFVTRSARAGRIPTFGPVTDTIATRFAVLVADDPLLEALSKRIAEIVVDRDEITLTLK